jgi:hypothetical protein
LYPQLTNRLYCIYDDLLKTREHLTSLANTKVKLSQLYDRVLENLQHGSPEIKTLVLDALDIKVYAKGNDKVEIRGVILLELASPTIARTSHHCSTVGILILREKGMLCQEHSRNNNGIISPRVSVPVGG